MARPRSTDSPQARLARLASRQHGLVTRNQARWCGFTDHEIDGRLRRGELVTIRTGVLAVAGVPPSWVQTAHAAQLATGIDAPLAGPTATRVWEMHPRPPSNSIHLLTPLGHGRTRRPGITAHRSAIIDPSDITRRHGLVLTCPPRTLADCAGDLGADGLGRALDDSVRRGLLTLTEMRATSARLMVPGRPHRKVLAQVLAERLPGYDPGDSDLEVRGLTALRRAGLPTPAPQHPVSLADGTIHIDLAYPEHLIGIELDGWEWHSQRSAFDRDRHRLSWLTTAGWAMLVATSRTVDTDLPAQVREALASRTALLRLGA